jgi:ubiquinone biosynthesis protein
MQIPLMLLAGVFILTTIAAFAYTVRGLLGINFSLVRLVIAGSIIFACFTPIMNAILDPEELEDAGAFPGVWFFSLGIALSLLTGMVFLVIAEALVPSNTLPGPFYMARAFRRWLRRSRRYGQIARIILRHGLTAYVFGGRRAELQSPEGRAELARRLRLAMSEGGVTFVKLGQILSTRRDILPREFVDELSQLQDRADNVPWDRVRPTLQRELGNDVDALFATFEREPLAAASIAQVHAARLQAGDDVVVKVRRPGVDAQVERDLDIVHRLAQTLQRSTGWGRRIGVIDLANGFAVALREELDLRVEARNIATIATAAARRGDDTGLHIPILHPELSTGQVLVMERIRGIPLGSAGSEIAARGLDPDALARTLLESLLRQVVIDGTFHADPHPGNVMLLPNDKLTLLDFGSVGRIDAVLRGALVRLILSFEQGDPIAASDALLDLVERPEGLDEFRLERVLGQFMARHLAPGVPPDARMFADLFRIIADFGLSVPPEVAAVFRAIATLEGTLTQIAPGFNIIGEARSFATSYLAEQFRPRALKRTFTDELTLLLPMLRRLPRRIDRIAAALEEGRLNVNVRSLADERDRRTVATMLHEVLLTILASTAGIMAVIVLGQEGGPQVTRAVSMFELIGYGLLVGALILGMRVLVLIFRPPAP